MKVSQSNKRSHSSVDLRNNLHNYAIFKLEILWDTPTALSYMEYLKRAPMSILEIVE